MTVRLRVNAALELMVYVELLEFCMLYVFVLILRWCVGSVFMNETVEPVPVPLDGTPVPLG